MTVERRHDWWRIAFAALLALAASGAISTPAVAQTQQDGSAAWYVVGDVGGRAPDAFNGTDEFSDRMSTDQTDERVALGLTLSNAPVGPALGFVATTPGGTDESADRFTFLVSGAYDWYTGTMVTPRLMAGVGLSYLDADGITGRPSLSSTDRTDLAPAMHLGIGADVAVTGSLDLSAEYRAFYRGAADVGGTERDPQIDQKFMLGAKIRF